MNIITLIRLTNGRKYQGFLDWDGGGARIMNFYYYDEDMNAWGSRPISEFKPVPLLDQGARPVDGTLIGG